jgi:hypothetical protein
MRMNERTVESGGFGLALLGTLFIDLLGVLIGRSGALTLGVYVFTIGGFASAFVAWDWGRRSGLTAFTVAVVNSMVPVAAAIASLGMLLLPFFMLAGMEWSF